MRQLAATVLAIPVIVGVVIAALVRRPAGRLASALTVGAALGLGVLSLVPPPPTAATPPTVTGTLPTAEFQVAVAVGQALREPVAIEFAAPMDAASVAGALRIQPPSAVHLLWNDAGTRLTVAPVGHWQPGVLHTVTVAPTATAADGSRLASPLRAMFLTRDEARTAIAATREVGDRVRLDTAFVVDFERPVDLTRAAAAFRIEPHVAGTLTSAGDGDATGFVFRPAQPLAPGTTYRVSLSGLTRDVDGAPLAALPELVVRTVDAPGVVRFRPRPGTEEVERGQAISVRFTQPMDRRATARAFTVTVNGTPIEGTIRWAERDTVLVFDPDAALPYDARVEASVGTAARSRLGVSLSAAASAAFTVEAKPAPPAPRPVTRPTTTTRAPSTGSSGGSVASATWGAVERYYLRLMNCTRTGGWVTSTGACSSPGGRAVAPLKLDAGISSRVARPYARLLATRGACSHFIGGNPGDRLRRAGYTSYRWAENLGCRSGNPTSAVLGSHLFFQSERPYNGGHYRNLMDARYDRVGIGVWVSSGRVRLVVNFYHP
ncbi:MAG TPA: Ig-like domain-containing protein [Candidatus Limnocylindrales bacterium]|nr:Ig-like domain-containing protein [Candidatus Limnocylindrales bacterium]